MSDKTDVKSKETQTGSFKQLSSHGEMALFSLSRKVPPPSDVPGANASGWQLIAIYGGSLAYTKLGICYQQGLGVNKDSSRALELYRLATRATSTENSGYPQYALGMYYFSNRDYSKAAHLLKYVIENFKTSSLVNEALTTLANCIQQLTSIDLAFGLADKNFILEITNQFFAVSCDVDRTAIPNFNSLKVYEGFIHIQTLSRQIEALEKSKIAPKDLLANLPKDSLLGHLYLLADNTKKAFDYYTLAAKQGDTEGIFFLGLCFLHGCGTEQDFNQAVYYFKIAAKERKLGAARKVLAACYEWGLGVTENRAIAQQIRQGAELTEDLFESKSTPILDKKTTETFSQVTTSPSSSSFILTTTSPSSNPCTPHTISSSSNTSQLMTEISDQKEEKKSGYRTAALEKRVLDKMNSYSFEDNLEIRSCLEKRNFKEAAVLLKLALLKGSLNVTESLGALYEQGQGVKKSKDQASTLYRLAYWQDQLQEKPKTDSKQAPNLENSRKGWYQSYIRLLIHFRMPTEPAFSQSKITFAEGEKYHREALRNTRQHEWSLHLASEAYDKAFSSADDDETLYSLAKFYLAVKNNSWALQCLHKAAANGHVKSLARLTASYLEGLGVSVNENTANSLQQLANKKTNWGDAENFEFLNLTRDICQGETTLNLAHHFFLQEDVSGASLKQAVKLYQQAADQGNAKACYFLALCYLHGKGVKQNFARAIYYLKEATIKGKYQPAKDLLVFCFQWGIGVKENTGFAEALEYCKISNKSQLDSLLKDISEPWSFSFSNSNTEITSPYTSPLSKLPDPNINFTTTSSADEKKLTKNDRTESTTINQRELKTKILNQVTAEPISTTEISGVSSQNPTVDREQQDKSAQSSTTFSLSELITTFSWRGRKKKSEDEIELNSSPPPVNTEIRSINNQN